MTDESKASVLSVAQFRKQLEKKYGQMEATAQADIDWIVARYAEARQASAWQPIADAPKELLRAILLYPAFKLDQDGELTAEPAGEPLATISYRNGNDGWEEIDPTLEATGAFFEDGWEYGEPTHFQPMPLPLAPPVLEDDAHGR